MKCLDIQDRIVDLILGEIEPQEKEIILNHLAQCPFCADDFKFLSECISICSCPELKELDETYWEDFVISVHERIVTIKPKPLFPYRIVLPIVASAIGIFGFLYFFLFKPISQEVSQPLPPEIQKDPFGEIYELTPEEQKEFIKMINQRYFGE